MRLRRSGGAGEHVHIHFACDRAGRYPVYKITGEGNCTLTINGHPVTANVAQNLTIDTDKMVAYREDGTLQNTSVTGDYEDMYLWPGQNAITLTEGFTLTVIPNWRRL